MKKIVPLRFGKDYQVKFIDVEVPQPCPTEVLIKVEAAAMNRAEMMILQYGEEDFFRNNEFLGIEAAGVIVGLGKEVNHLKLGDRVATLVQSGAYAEYVISDQRTILQLPSNMSAVEMAAVPEAFVLSFQLLKWIGGVQKGDSVLIHAGASSMGATLIQFAKQMDAFVIATSRDRHKKKICLDLGADHFIEVKGGVFAEEVMKLTDGAGIDLILDSVGKSYVFDNLESLAREGCMVLYGEMSGEIDSIPMGKVISKWNRIVGTTLRMRGQEYKAKLIEETLRFAMPLLEARKIWPTVYQTFSFNEIEQAFKIMETNQNHGRIVLTGFES